MHKKYVYKIWTDRRNESKWDTASVENICITSDTAMKRNSTAYIYAIIG